MDTNVDKIKIEDFARMLNGRKYGQELTKEDIELAKKLGFVVIFGCSDDLVEFEGAISDEAGSYNGKSIYITKTGLFKECECNCEHSQIAKENAKIIKAIWDNGEYSWSYNTLIPHEEFDILDDGEKYCRGIVLNINDLS